MARELWPEVCSATATAIAHALPWKACFLSVPCMSRTMAYLGGQSPGVMINLSQPIPAGNVRPAVERAHSHKHQCATCLPHPPPISRAVHHLPVILHTDFRVQGCVHKRSHGPFPDSKRGLRRDCRGALKNLGCGNCMARIAHATPISSPRYSLIRTPPMGLGPC